MKAVLTLLLPAIAFASPPPRLHRLSTLLLATDKAAESKTLSYEKHLNDALSEFASVKLYSSDELFGTPLPISAELAADRAEESFVQGKRAFETTRYADAEKKLAAALREYRKGAAALSDVRRLTECLAMYSAALFQRNEKKKAQEALSALVSIAPDYEPPAKYFSKPFILWKAQMTSQPKPMGGNLNVSSNPAGARVFIDGKEMGYAPMTLDTLTRGFHLLRLERPGFTTHGEFVQLYATDATLSIELKPITKYKAFDALAQEISDDVLRGKSSAALGRLGKTLGLDRVLMGVLKQTDNSGTTELVLGIFDAANEGKQLAFRRTSVVGQEYGELKSELQRVATSLLVAAEGRPLASKRKPDDPLEGKSGLEEWGGEDRGGRVEDKTKKPLYRDPLDSVSGTEDW